MAIIPTYKDYFEKERYFTVIYIDSKKDFDKYFEDFQNKENSVWRGLNESKYKLYTSLQRFWIENDFKDDIDEVIKYIEHCNKFSLKWNNNFLEKYFENNNIGNLQLFACLSFLRHHGNPSPLMDWSRNPNVALYFASRYSIIEPSNSKIENRFTLYEFTSEHPYFKMNYKELAKGFWTNKEKELRLEYKKTKEEDPDFISNFIKNIIGSQDFFFAEVKRKNGTMFKIEDKENDENKFYVNNNYNITNQDGLFLINAYPVNPLEESMENEVNRLLQKTNLGDEHFKETVKQKHTKNQIAYEIHKNLSEYVLYKIEKKGIIDTFIYPDPNQLASDCLKDYLRS